MKPLLTTLSFVLLGWGFANAQEDSQSTDSTRHEDLVKAKSAFKETWVHPDADFSQYDKLYIWEASFEYRDVGPARSSRSTMMSSRSREFGISDTDRAKFEEVIKEGFLKGVQKGKRFTLVDEVGPDTIIMRGGLLDIISRVPPETVGRSDIYLSNIGEATIIMELLDAETGDILAVVSERREIGGQPGGMNTMTTMPTSNVTIISDVRRFAQRAGQKLGSELDKAIKKAK